MTDIPEDDLEETRAALASTLEATAAILPWLAKPRLQRFDEALNQRWIDACKRISAAWSERTKGGEGDFRPAVFALYAIALETADADCLRLGEALACAADRLEEYAPTPRLLAALVATIECLGEPEGLEHEAFPGRAQHFAQRLEGTLAGPSSAGARSAILDRLFVDEAEEHIEAMLDALAALPPDAYALKSAALLIVQQAEHLELFGIMHQARQLAGMVETEPDLDLARDRLSEAIRLLAQAIAAVLP